MSYFLIYPTEDGPRVRQFSTPEGVRAFFDGEPIKGFRANTNEPDPNYWGEQCLIIRGEIVVPQPKTVVQEWDFGA